MRLSRLSGAIALGLVASLVFAQAPTTGTVEDLVHAALDANQDYLSLKERVTEAKAVARQAGLRPGRAIEEEAGTGAITGSRNESEFSAAYLWTMERGGKREKRVAAAEIGIALAEAELRERERNLAFDIQSRSVVVLTQEQKVASMRSLLGTSQESYRLTAQRVSLGDAAPLEQQLLLAEVRRTEAQIAAADVARDAAFVDLLAAVGLPSGPRISLNDRLRIGEKDPTLAQLQSYALEHRPDLLILKLLEQQAAADIDVAAADARRDLTASARYTHTRSAFDQFGLSDSGAVVPLRDADNVISFGLTIPLSPSNRAQPAIDAAKSRQSQQTLRREHLLRTIPVEVEAAYKRWIGAKRTIELLRTGVIEPSEGSLTVIREAYRLGQLRMLDVLNEQRRIGDLQLSFIDAQSDAARALVELERAIGGPLP